MKKILLIGCGHMGESLLVSWLKSNKYSLTVVDPLKINILKKKYKNKNISFFRNIENIDTHMSSDYIVIAVKPSDLEITLNELKKIKFNNNTKLISVVAGKKIKIFEKKFKNLKYFFRVMPNMPALVGQSMNCIVSNKNSITKINKKLIKLLSHSGKTLILKNEKQIDMATAISGSGPGYIFNIIDAMEKAAIKLGFSKSVAKSIVSQTFKGSINLFLYKNIEAQDLVKSVATKGGTTEAGIKIMNKYQIHNIFTKLAKASFKKAKDQGK